MQPAWHPKGRAR